MAAQGPPLYWVGNHRRHHRYVDHDGDPHSPNWGRSRQLGAWEGFWHAHVGWTLKHELSNAMEHCPDLLRDATVRWVARHYFTWIVLGLLLPAAAGLAITQSWAGFFQGLLWGGFLRLFFSYHMVNGINSLGHNHRWGYRRFDSSDSSRNIWFLGVFSLGEGWHNNHHADGSVAIFSRAWHEFDVGGMFIVGLEKLGLAHQVRRSRSKQEAS
jgi:stearoyl-CoA desaturase (delta-9 desaturase)